MKLKSKERFGSRAKKSYYAPQTPYQRVPACNEVTAADKKKLQRQYQSLNPAALKRQLDKYRKELFTRAALSTARSRLYLQSSIPAASWCDGNPGSADGTAIAMAERVRGAFYWLATP
jgi:hypothetical protein